MRIISIASLFTEKPVVLLETCVGFSKETTSSFPQELSFYFILSTVHYLIERIGVFSVICIIYLYLEKGLWGNCMTNYGSMEAYIQHFIHHSDSTKRQQKLAIFFAFLLFGIFLIVFPFAHTEWREVPTYISMYTVTIALLKLITMYLLFSEFIVSRSPALAVLASAYLFIGLLAAIYSLTFPGIFTMANLLNGTNQTPGWFYIFWQTIFAIYVFVYSHINKRFNKQLSHKQARIFLITCVTVTIILVSILSALAVFGTSFLPIVVNNGEFISLTSGFGICVWGTNLVTLMVLLFQKKERSFIELWVTVTIFATFLSTILALYASSRFSFGWYTSRAISTLSAGIVLSALLFEIRRLYNSVAEKEYIFRMLFESSKIGIVRTDLRRDILEANQSFYKTFGYSKEEVTTLEFAPAMPEEGAISDEIYVDLMNGKMENYQLEKHYRHKNGNTIWANTIVSVIRKTNNQPASFLFMVEDITERKRQEETIYFQAYYDSLTGLLKRNAFIKRVNIAMVEASIQSTRFGVMFFDLDGFKSINDTYGHDIGDLLLKKVADRLVSISREGDIFARMGGDEFTALFPHIHDTEGMEKIAKRILKIVTQPCELEGLTIQITLSIGISIYPDHGRNEKDLIKCADTAMYTAKQSGKNKYVVFHPSK